MHNQNIGPAKGPAERHKPWSLEDQREKDGAGLRGATLESILSHDKIVTCFKLDLPCCVSFANVSNLKPRTIKYRIRKLLRELGFGGLKGMVIGVLHGELMGNVVTFHLRGIVTDEMADRFQKVTEANPLNWEVAYARSYLISDRRAVNLPHVVDWLRFCTLFHWGQQKHWEETLGAMLFFRQKRGALKKYGNHVGSWWKCQRPYDLTLTYGTRLREGFPGHYWLTRSDSYW